MKKGQRLNSLPGMLVAAGLIISLGLIAWTGGPGNYPANSVQNHDTVPKKSGRDLDKELKDLEQGKKALSDLKDKDWDKIHRDIENAMKNIDFEKIRLQTEAAIEKIDFDKIGKDIEASLAKIDFDKIEKDIQLAVDEVSKIDKEQIKKEIEKARTEVNEQLQKKEWRKEMEEVKKIDLKHLEQEMEKVRKDLAKVKDELSREKFDMKETMKKAHADIDKAKEQLQGYQEMIYSMEKEGLLTTSTDYTIEFKNGELSVNGKKQPAEVANRYKKYFDKDSITIKKRDGDLSIDND